MIKNQKQAGITKEKIAELKTHLKQYKITGDEILDKLATESLEGMISELEEDLKYYNKLTDGDFHCLQPKSLEEVPEVLIAARLAQKLSQKDLADILGLKEQQIQRYESTNYETASWIRIVEVSMALKLQISFEKILIMNLNNNFSYPSNTSKEQAEIASEKIRNQGSLIIC